MILALAKSSLILCKGYQVCLPISEHLPFDLIAVSEAMAIRRIQVKYREARNGAVEVPLRASYSDGSGVHTRFVDLDGFDAIAVYCPDVGEVYYVPVSCLHSVKAKLTLRITDPMNNQTKGIKKQKIIWHLALSSSRNDLFLIFDVVSPNLIKSGDFLWMASTSIRYARECGCSQRWFADRSRCSPKYLTQAQIGRSFLLQREPFTRRKERLVGIQVVEDASDVVSNVIQILEGPGKTLAVEVGEEREQRRVIVRRVQQDDGFGVCFQLAQREDFRAVLPMCRCRRAGR